jgi:hypothetical protein
MKKSNEKIVFPVLYESRFGFNQFLSNLKHAENAFNNIAKDWNSLELGAFDRECLDNLYRADYFRNRYSEKLLEKIEKLDLPRSLKETLFESSKSPEGYRSLFIRMDSLLSQSARLGHVAMNGGFRSFNVDMTFFQVNDGVVSLVLDIEERVITQFQILGDTPEKIAVFEKMNQAAECLSELTSLLEETGLFRAHSIPLVQESPLFYLEGNSYKARPEILL